MWHIYHQGHKHNSDKKSVGKKQVKIVAPPTEGTEGAQLESVLSIIRSLSVLSKEHGCAHIPLLWKFISYLSNGCHHGLFQYLHFNSVQAPRERLLQVLLVIS